MQTDVSIVIVSWNTRELLRDCLLSVYNEGFAGTPATFEVIVVDNTSSDGSAQMVRECFPQVKLMANRENVGFARANNQAIPMCTGRYILLLNPDTRLKPAAMGAMLGFMDANPQAGACGSRLLNPDGTLQVSCHPAPTLPRELWRLFHLDRLKAYAEYRMAAWDVQTPREVDVIQGASFLIRREVVDRIGLLDEDYFIYSEEVDWCRRIQADGWHIYWVPQSQVVHFGGQSTRQVATEMFLRLYQGKVLYFHKHHGATTARLYKVVLLLAALARVAVGPLAYLEGPAQRREHLALAGRYRTLITRLPGF
jgi:GT2 family glycosyltransferase